MKGQRNSFVAHWFSVTGEKGSNPGGGEMFSSFVLSGDLVVWTVVS